MSHTVTVGGDRLGAGKKQKVQVNGFERSTHDLSYIWRNTQAAGTLVPFMGIVGLPGDTFDIDLNCDVKTHPTIGPLFGSFKVQLDVFHIPMRIYQGILQMNAIDIGLKMKTVKLPQFSLYGNRPTTGTGEIDIKQVNPSSLMRYLGIAGLGNFFPSVNGHRKFNAVRLLAYWDIYQQYYANKQEEIGAYIHAGYNSITAEITDIIMNYGYDNTTPLPPSPPDSVLINTMTGTSMIVTFELGTYQEFDPDRIIVTMKSYVSGFIKQLPLNQLYTTFNWNETGQSLTASGGLDNWMDGVSWYLGGYEFDTSRRVGEIVEPKVKTFPLEDITKMRIAILRYTEMDAAAFNVNGEEAQPYKDILDHVEVSGDGTIWAACQDNQDGLGLKTYQSDQFNNWISTEWIDGDDGVNKITAIDTTAGSFTIDELNLASKVYKMLNRIAISGGTYSDYINAVYDQNVTQINNPVYMGGLIKELVFQEVVSNSEAANGSQPLGTLAGRGVLARKHKGGKIRVSVNEPSYIMGIVSLTPRIDYSQGNDWDVNLESIDDLHKPDLDQIGFQDLITDQMAWWDTTVEMPSTNLSYKSAGKQPAWTNYMTATNQIRGNFADETQQMFMVLNRRYEPEFYGTGDTGIKIKDLTTYIDPAKFNYIFADTRRDAQNFWVQIACDITARRKMSAKIMPNL